jgi:hypothetical protein
MADITLGGEQERQEIDCQEALDELARLRAGGSIGPERQTTFARTEPPQWLPASTESAGG